MTMGDRSLSFPTKGSWAVWALALIVFQLAILRELSAGRFMILSVPEADADLLWIFHTITKITLFGAAATLLAAIVERRFANNLVIGGPWRGVILTLQLGLFGLLVVIVGGLPKDIRSVAFPLELQARYFATSATFFAWQLSSLLLVAPPRLWREVKPQSIAFIGLAMLSAAILSANQGALLSVVSDALEDITLKASLFFYSILGRTDPLVFVFEGIPRVKVGDFIVGVGTACAGYQGLLASTTIMVGLLLLEWKSLKPGPAIALAVVTVTTVFVMNSVRIGTLLHIGEAYSAEMAVNGFHSYFGTLSLFAVIALGMFALQQPFFRRVPTRAVHDSSSLAACSTADARNSLRAVEAYVYLLPLSFYLVTTMVVGLFETNFNWLYPVSTLVGFALLYIYRNMLHKEFADGVDFSGFGIGMLVFIFWILMIPQDTQEETRFAEALSAVPLWVAIGWVIMRTLGSSIVVPILEELAFRAGLLRVMKSLARPHMGRMPALAVAILGSSLAFGFLHSNIWAGTVAGIGYGVLIIRTGRIGNAIVAHAVTNFLIAVTAIGVGRWSLW